MQRPGDILSASGARLLLLYFGAIVVSTRRKMKLKNGFEQRKSFRTHSPQGQISRYKPNPASFAFSKMEGKCSYCGKDRLCLEMPK